MTIDTSKLVKLSVGLQQLEPEVSKGHAQRLLKSGEWPGYMIGNRWYINVEEIQALRFAHITGDKKVEDVFS